MWRNKQQDLGLLQSFERNLNEFKKLKLDRWEQIEEDVQMSIKPGVPSEDWIIPPDENKTAELLEKDPDYNRLRSALNSQSTEIKACAKFLDFNTHHDFDWLKFTNPLIGNSALNDAIKTSQKLLQRCEQSNYFIKNIQSIFTP